MIESGEIQEARKYMDMYKRCIEFAKDGLVIIERSPNFSMHLDIEKHLFVYASEMLKDNVYFHPMFEERSSFLDMMDGQTDVVLGDLRKLELFLESKLGVLESSHPDIYAFKRDMQHSIFSAIDFVRDFFPDDSISIILNNEALDSAEHKIDDYFRKREASKNLNVKRTQVKAVLL